MKYTRKHLDELKKMIPNVAFDMFVKHGIETVSMQNIADEVGVGFTTMYRYFQKKSKLVVQIAVLKWREYFLIVEKNYKRRNGLKFNAKEELEFCIDSYIDLYRNHKDLLKFTYNVDLYIIEHKLSAHELKPYYDCTNVFREKFHNIFIKAEQDGSIRLDIKEDRIFFLIMHSMLAISAKYAFGAIFPKTGESNHLLELELQKRAYMEFMTNNQGDLERDKL